MTNPPPLFSTSSSPFLLLTPSFLLSLALSFLRIGQSFRLRISLPFVDRTKVGTVLLCFLINVVVLYIMQPPLSRFASFGGKKQGYGKRKGWRENQVGGGRKIVETSTTKDGLFNRKLYLGIQRLFLFFLFNKR